MKNKILYIVAAIVLIGIIVVAIWGFNVDLCYKNHHLVNIEIGQEFSVKDIKTITNEVFPNEKLEIQKSGIYKDNLVIKVTEISEEQKVLLNTKINEKYGISNDAESIEVHYVPSFRLLDIVKPYIVPMIIATALVLVYMCVMFRKVGIVKVLTQTIMLSVIAEALYVAIIAITRYPINRLVMPVAIVIYMAVITILNLNLGKQTSIKEKN